MDTLEKRLKIREGLSLEAYKDSEGYWTIGYGHKLRRGYGPKVRNLFGRRIEQLLEFRFRRPRITISLHEADELLRLDLYKASDQFMRWKCDHCPRLDVTRSGVCVELIFWVGFTGFKKFKKMTAALEVKDYELAALELYNSKIGKKYSTRAKCLAVLMWEGKLEAES